MKTGQHPSLTSLQETGHYIISEKPVEQHIPNKGMRFDYSRDSSRTTVPNVCTSRPSQSASTTKKKNNTKPKFSYKETISKLIQQTHTISHDDRTLNLMDHCINHKDPVINWDVLKLLYKVISNF